MQMIKALAVILLLLALGSSHKERPADVIKPPKVVARILLKVPFRVLEDATLAVDAQVFFGEPSESCEGLWLLLANEAIRITSLSQLRGRVQIKSPTEALAFCRLLTAPTTFRLWQPWELEILNADEVDGELLFVEEFYSRSLHREDKTSGFYGIVSSPNKLRQMGIRRARVRATAAGYEIRRTLMVEDHDRDWPHMAKVVEIVGHDGGYVRTKTHVDDLPAGVNWTLPPLSHCQEQPLLGPQE